MGAACVAVPCALTVSARACACTNHCTRDADRIAMQRVPRGPTSDAGSLTPSECRSSRNWCGLIVRSSCLTSSSACTATQARPTAADRNESDERCSCARAAAAQVEAPPPPLLRNRRRYIRRGPPRPADSVRLRSASPMGESDRGRLCLQRALVCTLKVDLVEGILYQNVAHRAAQRFQPSLPYRAQVLVPIPLQHGLCATAKGGCLFGGT